MVTMFCYKKNLTLVETIHFFVFWSQKMTCGSLGVSGVPELQAGEDTEPPRDGDGGDTEPGRDLEGEPGCAGGLPETEPPPEAGLPPLLDGEEGLLGSGRMIR